MNYKKINELLVAEVERKETRTTADIMVRCPLCKLPHTEYDEFDDEWHIIECDRCGQKYKYRTVW